MKPCLLSLMGSVLVLTSACAAAGEEPGADESAVSQDAAITGRLAAGAELVTTTRVNLREGPSTKEAVLTTLATGTTVRVVTGQSSGGFYEVSADGERGWVYGTYLRPGEDTEDGDADADAPSGAAPLAECLDASAASRMVREARGMDGSRSQGLCYRYVKSHIEDAGVMSRGRIPAAYQASAYQFAAWARRDPSGFAAAGFARSDATFASIPPGAVIVWRPGQCGYSAQHGHIEIAIGGGRACSDFCGAIKRGCGMPEVFVPTKATCR